jgi:hypothetical protein
MQKLLVWGVLAIAACGGGQKGEPAEPASAGNGAPIGNKVPAESPPVAPRSDTDVAMAAMVGFRDKFCACVDSLCAQKVSDEMTAWGQEWAKKNDKPPKMTDEQVKRMQEVGMQMGECMTKAMTNNQNPPPNTGNNPCGGGP